MARKLYQKLIIIPFSRQPKRPIPPTLRQSTSSYNWATFDLQTGLGLESTEIEEEEEEGEEEEEEEGEEEEEEEEEEEDNVCDVCDVCDKGDGRLCGSR